MVDLYTHIYTHIRPCHQQRNVIFYVCSTLTDRRDRFTVVTYADGFSLLHAARLETQKLMSNNIKCTKMLNNYFV